MPSTAAAPVTRRLIVLAAVVAVVVALGYEINQALKKPVGGNPHTDNPKLAAVRTFDYAGGVHTTDPVHYAQTPPAGGPHDPTWDDCGVYSAPVRNENAVHDLEHGTVWITYRPGLSPTGVSNLEMALGTVKSGKTMLSPYPGLPAPVVVTVWNAQLRLTGPGDPRLPVFLSVYGDGHTGPEAAFASCKGGAHVMASPDNP